MGDAVLSPTIDQRLDDHGRRIVLLEQDRVATRQEIASLQLRLVEVQTEGRMRGERQDADLHDLKAMTRDLLGGMSFFRVAFKWLGGAVAGSLIFIAIWGPKLVSVWQAWHHP